MTPVNPVGSRAAPFSHCAAGTVVWGISENIQEGSTLDAAKQ